MNTIVQGNDLIEGSYKVTMDEFRLLNIALSKIDSKSPQPDIPYVITIEDFESAYGISPHNSHVRLRDSAKGLLRKPIVIYRENPKTKKIEGIEFPWFSIIKYGVDDNNTSVMLRFSEYVRPHLFELSKNFTSVMFKNIAKLDTQFSVKLYNWLSKARNLKKHHKNGTITTVLNIEWMKERAGFESKYADYRVFRLKVIEPAISKINAVTDLSVAFNPIRKAGKITDLEFIYIEEEKVTSKPVRKRLPRRPHVSKGSHAEGVWARECINIMCEYDLELVDSGYQLEVRDLERMQSWYSILGDVFAVDELEQEINKRKRGVKL